MKISFLRIARELQLKTLGGFTMATAKKKPAPKKAAKKKPAKKGKK